MPDSVLFGTGLTFLARLLDRSRSEPPVVLPDEAAALCALRCRRGLVGRAGRRHGAAVLDRVRQVGVK